MAPPRSWIYTKSRSHPPNGILRLGQILAEADNPLSAKITTKEMLIPEDILVDNSCHDYKNKNSAELDIKWKSWIKAHGIPLAGSILGKLSTRNLEDWTVDELHGEVMPLNDAFAQKMLQDENVVSYTNQNRRRFRNTGKLYMVTGIRWAKGGSLKKSQRTELEGGAAGQAGPAGPLDAGAGAHALYKNENEESITEGTDFVFQYALHELRYGAKYKAKPYRHGDTESADEDLESGSAEPTDIESLEFRGWNAVEEAPLEEIAVGPKTATEL